MHSRKSRILRSDVPRFSGRGEIFGSVMSNAGDLGFESVGRIARDLLRQSESVASAGKKSRENAGDFRIAAKRSTQAQ